MSIAHISQLPALETRTFTALCLPGSLSRPCQHSLRWEAVCGDVIRPVSGEPLIHKRTLTAAPSWRLLSTHCKWTCGLEWREFRSRVLEVAFERRHADLRKKTWANEKNNEI